MDGLLSVAEANERISPLAAYIFKHRYSHHRFLISRENNLRFKKESPKPINIFGIEIHLDKKKKEPANYWIYNDGDFAFRDYNTTLMIFKHFGDAIRKLDVNYDGMQHGQANRDTQLFNNYSAHSIEEIQFVNYEIYNLKLITRPLTNAKIVKFIRSGGNNINEPYPMELFPAVERLIPDYSYTNISNFDFHMPNLKHFYARQSFYEIGQQVGISWGKYLIKLTEFAGVLSNNSHLRSIEMEFDPVIRTEYFEIVKVMLPKLENLTVHRFEVKQNFSMDSVTTFSMKYDEYYLVGCPPDNLTFPNLQNLFVSGVTRLNEWHGFFVKHNFLSRFNVKVHHLHDAKFTQITALTNQLSNLIELTVSLSIFDMNYIDSIRNLLDRHTHLELFKLSGAYCIDFDPVRKNLEEYGVDRTWHITTTNSSISLRR